jgi:hypothetical protein
VPDVTADGMAVNRKVSYRRGLHRHDQPRHC